MTHKERLRQVLSEMGIPYEERVAAAQAYPSEEGSAIAKEWESAIELQEGIGLPGFVTSFYFDDDDSFLAHRVWKVG